MTALLTIALVVVVAAAISGATMTALRRERKSIDRHRRTMGVMGGISGAANRGSTNSESSPPVLSSHVRKVGGAHTKTTIKPKVVPLPKLPAPRQTLRELIQAGKNEGVETPLLEEPLETPSPILESRGDTEVDTGSDSFQSQDKVASRFSGAIPTARSLKSAPGSRQLLGTGAVVVLGAALLIFGAVKFLGRGAGSGATSTTSTTSSTVATTTTTVPPVISPLAQTAAGATFKVPAGSITYTLTVTAPCWVEQSQTPYGSISWDGVIQPGQSKVITTSSALWLRAGNSTVLHITANSTPVAVTTAPGPFNYTFVNS